MATYKLLQQSLRGSRKRGDTSTRTYQLYRRPAWVSIIQVAVQRDGLFIGFLSPNVPALLFLWTFNNGLKLIIISFVSVNVFPGGFPFLG